jgi:hypothetical protein
MGILRRYWLRFAEQQPLPTGVRLGCGVTALSVEDALRIVQKDVFQGAILPPVGEILEDVDISMLDQDHVAPNMEEPASRGVWFPMGHRKLERH